MVEKLTFYLGFPFVQYAMIVGVLIAVCAALLGNILVLKRLSFMGDSLSHVAFGAAIIAGLLKFTSSIALSLVLTTVCAIILFKASSRARGDAVLAVISVSSLALGYLAVNIWGSSANLAGDVCSTLFGSTSILTLTAVDVVICSVLAVVVIALFILFYKKIVVITFDETYARSTGINTGVFNTCLAIVVAVVIVLAMNLVGSLLITALVIFPVLSAMRLFHSFKAVTISAVIISTVCTLLGIVVSILVGTPVGSTIVATDLVVLLISLPVGKLVKRSRV